MKKQQPVVKDKGDGDLAELLVKRSVTLFRKTIMDLKLFIIREANLEHVIIKSRCPKTIEYYIEQVNDKVRAFKQNLPK